MKKTKFSTVTEILIHKTKYYNSTLNHGSCWFLIDGRLERNGLWKLLCRIPMSDVCVGGSLSGWWRILAGWMGWLSRGSMWSSSDLWGSIMFELCWANIPDVRCPASSCCITIWRVMNTKGKCGPLRVFFCEVFFFGSSSVDYGRISWANISDVRCPASSCCITILGVMNTKGKCSAYRVLGSWWRSWRMFFFPSSTMVM